MTHASTSASFARLNQLLLVEQHKAGLSAQEILIWDYIFSFCNGGNRAAWVSQKTLANVFGIQRHNVCRTIRRLKKKGWLKTSPSKHLSPNLHPCCPTMDVWSVK